MKCLGFLAIGIVLIVTSYLCVDSAETRIVQSPFLDPLLHTYGFLTTGKHADGIGTPWGIIIGSRIDLQSDEGRVQLHHEVIHIQQMKRYGLHTYALRYTYEFVRYGYQNVTFEKEAYYSQGFCTRGSP